MRQRERLFYSVMLLLLGAGWGFTQPMTKLSVSTGHGHFGLIFWQLVVGVLVMAVFAAIRGAWPPISGRHLRLYLIIALIGTLIPNTFSYQAAVHLPAGVISILYSMIPMLAFPIALGLALDQFEWRRFAGLGLGLAAVILIVGPGASFVGIAPLWVCVVLCVCLCYAFEGNYVAKWGTQGLDGLQVLFGASLVGLVLSVPLVAVSGQWIDPRPAWGVAEYALIAGSVVHVVVYAGYVWLVGAAGPVFAVMISYLVTITGVFWARGLLGETYAPTIWASMGLMLLGMYMVQPKRRRTSGAQDGAGI